MVDTQQAIVNLLGMDAETFRSCVLIMQDAYGSFMEARPEDRMSVLANLLGLGIYEAMEDAFRTRLTDLNRTIRDLKAAAVQNEYDKDQLAPLVDRLGFLRAADHVAGYLRLLELRARRDDVAAAAGGATNISADLARANSTLAELQREESELADRIASIRRNIEQTDAFLATEPELTALHEDFLAAQSAVLGMQGHVSRLQDMERRAAAVRTELATTMTSIQSIERGITDTEIKVGTLASMQAILEEMGDTDAALTHQEMLRGQFEALAHELAGIDVEMTHTEQRARTDIIAAETALGLAERQAKMLESSNCIDIGRAECKFLAEAKLIASTIEERQAALDAAHEWIASYKQAHADRVADITRRMDEIGYSSVAHAAAAENCRSARNMAMELAQGAAVHARLASLRDQLAQSAARRDALLEENATLATEIDAQRVLCSGVAAAQARLDSLKAAEGQYAELPAARRYVADNRPEIDAATDRQKAILTRIETATAEVGRLTQLAAAAQDTITALAAIDADIDREITSLSAIDRSIGSLEGQTMRLPELTAAAERIAADIATTATAAARMQHLVDAFGQEGIPHQIIRDIVPDLEAQANEILGTMTGGRMRLQYPDGARAQEQQKP